MLANHPGMTDTVALLAALAGRPDLRVIAGDRPFLRALPHVARSLILLPEGGGAHLPVLRAAIAHLQQGGALLTFPAGCIEPDPATFGRAPGAAIRCSAGRTAWCCWRGGCRRRAGSWRWSATWCRHRPSGIRSPWLRRSAADKEKLAAALQVALPRYQRMSRAGGLRCHCSPPARHDAASLRAAMLAQARLLIEGLPLDAADVAAWRSVTGGEWRTVHR